MMQFDAQSVLTNVRVPVLVIAGRHDRVTKPIASEHISQLASLPPPTYTDGGHLSIWEFHEHVLDSLDSFATKVVQPAMKAENL